MARAPSRRQLRLALVVLAVCGPAVWIGGALPRVVPIFCLVVGAWWLLARPRHAPAAAWIGVVATAIATLHWLPLSALRGLLAPEISNRVDQLIAGASVTAWPGATVAPGDTGLEAARLLGLTALFVLGAHTSWRRAAAVVAALASSVAVIGFVHGLVGAENILGIYSPREVLGPRPSLMTTFVNPNHQASLLVLGIASAAALVVDRCIATTPGRLATDRHRDHLYAGIAAITVMVPALLASLSRGALVAFALLAPVALVVALPRNRAGRSRLPRRAAWAKVLVGVALTAMVVVVAHDGAWAELQTLAEFDTPGTSAATKIRLATEATGLIAVDRPLGIGPGTFIDHFGALDSQPSHVVYAHLESMPIAAVVEYGWLGGGLLVAGVGVWAGHTFIALRRTADHRATRVLLAGIVAVLVHNLLGFSLAQLGVAAPVALVAGSLSRARWPISRAARVLVLVALAGAAALGAWAVPYSVAHRAAADAAVLSGAIDGEALLRHRPMDGRLHGLLARRAAEDGKPARARRWAGSAVDLRPGAPDPWLVLGAAHASLGDGVRSAEATRRGLARLHAPPPPELVDWLLLRYPTPRELVAVAPLDGEAWLRLAKAVRPRSAAHADAVAAARLRIAPADVHASQQRYAHALDAHAPALALHHARLWRAAAPENPHAHVAVAKAMLAFSPPRARDALRGLAPVVKRAGFSPADRGVIEEELLHLLLRQTDPASRQRAVVLAPVLVSRPASRAVQRRRERMVAPLLH